MDDIASNNLIAMHKAFCNLNALPSTICFDRENFWKFRSSIGLEPFSSESVDVLGITFCAMDGEK